MHRRLFISAEARLNKSMIRLFWRMDSDPPRQSMNLNSTIRLSVTRSCSRPVLPAPSDGLDPLIPLEKVGKRYQDSDGVDHYIDLPREALNRDCAVEQCIIDVVRRDRSLDRPPLFPDQGCFDRTDLRSQVSPSAEPAIASEAVIRSRCPTSALSRIVGRSHRPSEQLVRSALSADLFSRGLAYRIVVFAGQNTRIGFR